MSSAAPKVAVVIPCLNGEGTLARQLDAIASQRWSEPWEVVVSDNGSTDRSREIVRRYEQRLPGLRIVDSSARRGLSHALNAGVAATSARSVVFCDVDDEVGEGWLAAMGDALERHRFVGARQEVRKLNQPWVVESRDQERFTVGAPPLWFPPHLPHTGSGVMGIRRALYDEVGGFDESLPAADVDFCLKVQLRGVELVVASDAVVHYCFRNSLRGIARQSYRYAHSAAAAQRRYRPRQPLRLETALWPLRGWKPILATIPRLHRRGGRGRMAWLLGWQAGRFAGSVRYRVLAV
jgi:glycosyltransferase involved in cell wall biosynthesis